MDHQRIEDTQQSGVNPSTPSTPQTLPVGLIGSLSKKVHQMLNYLFYKTTILTGVGRETPLSSLRGVDVPPWLHK